MRTRRFCSYILVAALLLSSVFYTGVTALETAGGKPNADVPYIHVSGLMTSDIVSDVSDSESETVWPPQTSSILSAVADLLPALFRLKITRNYDKFADSLIPALKKVLEPSFLDISGDVRNKTGAICEYPDRDEIKKDSVLWFDYDWRADPFTVAAELDRFINYVTDCSGSEKVVLECHSYGGVITYTYIAEYGTDKLKGVLFNASAVYGETFTGDLCQGKLHLYDEALTEYLKGAFAHQDGEKFWNGFFKVLYKTGITGAICNAVNRVVDNTHDRLFSEIIFPMFGNWPSIWSMVTDEMYDDSVRAVFDSFYADDGLDHSEMRRKVEKFHTEIAVNREQILKTTNEKCNLYIVARYGYCSMFCTPSWRIANDMIVDVRYGSFGATAAAYGEVFGADYLENKDTKYISPEKNVDASTCLFPEQTWFIGDYMHMKSKPSGFFETLLYYDGQATVNTFSQYPRFLCYVDEDDTVAPAK